MAQSINPPGAAPGVGGPREGSAGAGAAALPRARLCERTSPARCVRGCQRGSRSCATSSRVGAGVYGRSGGRLHACLRECFCTRVGRTRVRAYACKSGWRELLCLQTPQSRSNRGSKGEPEQSEDAGREQGRAVQQGPGHGDAPEAATAHPFQALRRGGLKALSPWQAQSPADATALAAALARPRVSHGPSGFNPTEPSGDTDLPQDPPQDPPQDLPPGAGAAAPAKLWPGQLCPPMAGARLSCSTEAAGSQRSLVPAPAQDRGCTSRQPRIVGTYPIISGSGGTHPTIPSHIPPAPQGSANTLLPSHVSPAHCAACPGPSRGSERPLVVGKGGDISRWKMPRWGRAAERLPLTPRTFSSLPPAAAMRRPPCRCRAQQPTSPHAQAPPRGAANLPRTAAATKRIASGSGGLKGDGSGSRSQAGVGCHAGSKVVPCLEQKRQRRTSFGGSLRACGRQGAGSGDPPLTSPSLPLLSSPCCHLQKT